MTGIIIAALILCYLATMAFEFVNGSPDAANAVAIVIYTKTEKQRYPIIMVGDILWLTLPAAIILSALSFALFHLWL
jgi:phosphate/sulfate permease